MSDETQDSVIRLERVFKAFDGHEVLKGVSINVAKGRTLGIVGKSGTGKSVTLNLMIGLMQPDQGKVVNQERDLSNVDRKGLIEVRKNIGFLFQGAALFDSLCVSDNVAFPLRRHTKKRSREIHEAVETALEEVGLKGEGDKMPAQLSGGMSKRVGLARAVVLDPGVILADEPSSGLDAITAGEIYELLRKLKDRGKTLVVVTHDGRAMRGLVDEMVVLDQGEIVAQGSPQELAKNENPLVRELVGGSER